MNTSIENLRKANLCLYLEVPASIADDIKEKSEAVISEVERLEQWINDCQSGMYINCVYCGHRYGPDDGNHLVTMRDTLQAHIEVCPKHPMSKLKQENAQYKKILGF